MKTPTPELSARVLFVDGEICLNRHGSFMYIHRTKLMQNALVLFLVAFTFQVEMEFEKFLKLGQEIGLEGGDLVRFAQEREANQ